MTRVWHYFDYKSPYAYLAQAASHALAAAPGVTVEWVPYTLQIPKYLGEARLDAAGRDIVGTRNDHQWRRVRYAYMDCRREANRRGLTIRGPRRIFDSSLAHIAFLLVRGRPGWVRFHDAVFERFWRRELDLEDVGALAALLDACGFDGPALPDWLAGAGRVLHDELQEEAEAAGVFGVPSWRIDDELWWGLERLPRVCERLGVAMPPSGRIDT
ncbi:MAG: DsbA family protein [Gammaproteobacteria bacterium]